MGFFVYIGGSSFALQTIYGIGESTYAAVFTVNAITMVATSVLFRALVVRTGSARLRAVGLALAIAGAAGLLVVALLGTDRVPSLAVPWALFSFVTGGMG
jgi:DHA1 family bicyclomycin/chloramphenicol resistance-like MFS transporter